MLGPIPAHLSHRARGAVWVSLRTKAFCVLHEKGMHLVKYLCTGAECVFEFNAEVVIITGGAFILSFKNPAIDAFCISIYYKDGFVECIEKDGICSLASDPFYREKIGARILYRHVVERIEVCALAELL